VQVLGALTTLPHRLDLEGLRAVLRRALTVISLPF